MSRMRDQLGFGVIESLILIIMGLVLAVVVVSAYFSAKQTARDAQRVSDVVQLQKALKYHYEEFGYFPQASNNIAVGVDNSFSRFISEWPKPPTPADGQCNSQYNTYAYEQVNSGESYQIRFCLGEGYGNLKAGIRIATPYNYQ
jgi:type II secretory pathway pseudopilin PulG